MDEYKPKRFEVRNYIKDGWQRSVGFSLAREQYGRIKDWYFSIHFYCGGVTVVFWRKSF